MKVYLATNANRGVVNDSKRNELLEDILSPCGVYLTLTHAMASCQEEVNETWKEDQEYSDEKTKNEKPPQLVWNNNPATEWDAECEELDTLFAIYEREIEGE